MAAARSASARSTVRGREASAGRRRAPARPPAEPAPAPAAGTGPAAAAGAPAAAAAGEAPSSTRAMHKSVGWALTVAARLHRAELGERLAGLGLFPGQEQLLQALYDHETMTMSALATLMRVRPPTVSKAVARLAAQGLVARIDGDAGDGRLVRVRLTAAGRARAAEIARIWGETEQRLLEGFDSRERKKLRKLLRRVAANFSGAPAPAGREAENAG